MNEYLCVSVVGDDDGGYVALLKHVDASHVFATVLSDNPNEFVMGEQYTLEFKRSEKIDA